MENQFDHLSEAKYLMAFAGSLAPLGMCNVPYRTRDSLLLYNILQAEADILSLNHIPKGSSGALVSLLHSWGIDGRILNDVTTAIHTITITSKSGQWAIKAPGETITISSQIYSKSDLDSSLRYNLALAYILGKYHVDEAHPLALSLSAITASLYRSKHHDSFEYVQHNRNLYYLAVKREGVKLSKIERLDPLGDIHDPQDHQDHQSEIDQDILQTLSYSARQVVAALLYLVPVISFNAGGYACALIALISSPFYAPPESLETSGIMLNLLDSIGLKVEKLHESYTHTRVNHADGSSAFRSSFIKLHNVLSRDVKSSSLTSNALYNLRAHVAHIETDLDVRIPAAHEPDGFSSYGRKILNLFEVMILNLDSPTTKANHEDQIHPHTPEDAKQQVSTHVKYDQKYLTEQESKALMSSSDMTKLAAAIGAARIHLVSGKTVARK